MMDFFKWIINSDNFYTNIFTVITMVLSGLISLAISAYFFHKGNRNNLLQSVLQPIKQIILEEKGYTQKNYKKLESIMKEYPTRYLSKSERKIIDQLLKEYKDVCGYDFDWICAKTIMEYFNNKIKENGLEIKQKPLTIDGEVIDFDFVDDYFYMEDEIIKAFRTYHYLYEEELCKDRIISIFNSYCSVHYPGKTIILFNDYPLKTIIKNSDLRKDWKNKFNRIKATKGKFLNIKALKD